MNIEIVKPTIPDDVPQIQEVFYRTWLETYPNDEIGITRVDIEEQFKDRFSQEYIAKRAENLSKMPENQNFLVAKYLGNVVGVCRMIIRDEYNQLQSIYVLPEYQRLGIGKMFWNKALDFFEKNKKIIVQVATYNVKTIEFYKKLGFIDTGKRFTEERHRMPISGVLIPEMEMEMINNI